MTDRLHQEAWSYGRGLRDHLINRYREEYGVEVPPPPARIVGELLTDFMGAALRYDPLDLSIFAQTEWKDERPLVTVNSLIGQMEKVKDVTGVENVAKFHELIHVDRDLAALKSESQLRLPEFGPPSRIVCYRRTGNAARQAGIAELRQFEAYREFWAEEAGRAAAVSYAALSRSDAFRAFLRSRQSATLAANHERWQLLCMAAEDIGVNRSALVRQLALEGRIVVQQEGQVRVIYRQPNLVLQMKGGG